MILGIYDVNGNVLGHTGAINSVASTNMNSPLISNVNLAPGQYYMALCPSNASDTYLAVTGTGGATNTCRNRIAVNSGSSGVLPSTTDVYTNSPTKVTATSLDIQNGLT